METIELKSVNSATPVILPCVDGTNIVIVRARRVHHVEHDHGTWDYTRTILVTADGEEVEFDESAGVLHFDYVQNEIADKLFRVLDEPNAGMWPIVADQLLKLVASAAVEEVVKNAVAPQEDVAEAA